MAARKFTTREREKAKSKAARIWAKGATIAQIAEQVGVSHSQAEKYVATFRQQWRETKARDIEDRIAELLAENSEVKLEAWREWRRSKRNLKKTKSGTTDKGSFDSTETIDQCADPRYLQVIQKSIDFQADLYGVRPPKKIAPTTPEGNPLFGFLQKSVEEMTDDELAALRNAANALSANH